MIRAGGQFDDIERDDGDQINGKPRRDLIPSNFDFSVRARLESLDVPVRDCTSENGGKRRFFLVLGHAP